MHNYVNMLNTTGCTFKNGQDAHFYVNVLPQFKKMLKEGRKEQMLAGESIEIEVLYIAGGI